jgi:acetyl-CoA acetyltransferase
MKLSWATSCRPAGQTGAPGTIRAGILGRNRHLTINKVCGSGLKAQPGGDLVMAGQPKIIAGGMEKHADGAMALPKARWGYRMEVMAGARSLIFCLLTGFTKFYGYHMGIPPKIVGNTVSAATSRTNSASSATNGPKAIRQAISRRK